MEKLHTNHGAALWRYAVRQTGDHARAEDVVQETLLRMAAPGDRRRQRTVAAAVAIRVARNMIIDEHRSSRSRHEVSSPDGSDALERSGPDEVSAGLDDRADRRRPADRRRDGEIAAALRAARPAAYLAGNGRHPMTAGRSTAHGLVDHPITPAALKKRLARTSAQVAAYDVVGAAISNAAKYAQASKVNVCVEGEDANIRGARTRLNCAQPTGRSGPNYGAPTSASKGDE
jgi:hypothetical protein